MLIINTDISQDTKLAFGTYYTTEDLICNAIVSAITLSNEFISRLPPAVSKTSHTLPLQLIDVIKKHYIYSNFRFGRQMTKHFTVDSIIIDGIVRYGKYKIAIKIYPGDSVDVFYNNRVLIEYRIKHTFTDLDIMDASMYDILLVDSNPIRYDIQTIMQSYIIHNFTYSDFVSFPKYTTKHINIRQLVKPYVPMLTDTTHVFKYLKLNVDADASNVPTPPILNIDKTKHILQYAYEEAIAAPSMGKASTSRYASPTRTISILLQQRLSINAKELWISTQIKISNDNLQAEFMKYSCVSCGLLISKSNVSVVTDEFHIPFCDCCYAYYHNSLTSDVYTIDLQRKPTEDKKLTKEEHFIRTELIVAELSEFKFKNSRYRLASHHLVGDAKQALVNPGEELVLYTYGDR